MLAIILQRAKYVRYMRAAKSSPAVVHLQRSAKAGRLKPAVPFDTACLVRRHCVTRSTKRFNSGVNLEGHCPQFQADADRLSRQYWGGGEGGLYSSENTYGLRDAEPGKFWMAPIPTTPALPPTRVSTLGKYFGSGFSSGEVFRLRL